jgi:hypothetical protein
MKRTRFDSLVTEKALHLVNGADSSHILELMGNDPDYNAVLKNVCAKVSVQLSDKIDSVCGMLDISKRAFIEAALIQAVEQAEAIMDDEGVFEYLKESGHAVDRSSMEMEGKL